MKSLVKCAVFLLLLVLIGSSAWAQLGQMGQMGQSNFTSANSIQLTSSNFYFAKPNELTIIVNVMGYVQRPGRYEISKSIDLVNLIALAGGATPDGNVSNVKVTRLLEAEGHISRGEYTVDLENISKAKPSDLVLQPGDVIQLDRSGWASFRDAFTVVVSAAIIVTAVSQVIIASHY
jgi:hypothetical protein